MPTTINADTVLGGYVVTADASGTLALQASGNTALTVNPQRAIGVGQTPSFGTAGQVLTSQGSGASPTWNTVGSSALVYISTTTLTGYSEVGIIGGFTSTYDDYVLIVEGVSTNTSNTTGRILIWTGGTQRTANYQYVQLLGLGSASTTRSTSTSFVPTFPDFYGVSIGSMQINIFNANSTNGRIQGSITTVSTDASNIAGNNVSTVAFGYSGDYNAMTGISFKWGSPAHSFGGGTIKLYGVAKS
jgi:hypothetical protein